jgi:hypothetical protein
MVHGGVNFEPYKAKLFESIGRPMHAIETFPASEGFFAYQDSQVEEGLLLNTTAASFSNSFRQARYSTKIRHVFRYTT